jgi:hypothetical protein
MAISNFRIPTGLEVSGTDGLQLTGSLAIASGKVDVRNSEVSASAVSASVGIFGSINASGLDAPNLNLSENLTVDGNTILGDNAADYIFLSGNLTASQGVQVSGGDLKVTAGALSASSTLQAGGAATLAGGLTVTGGALDASAVQVSASALSASGDVTVGGKLSVFGNLEVTGTLTYINTQNLLVSDKQVVIASGSDSANANGAGIYLGKDDGSEIAKIYYTHADTAWNVDQDLKVAGELSASVRVVSNEVTGTTTTGSFAKFTDITGSYVSGINASFSALSGALSSSAIIVSDITAVTYGSYPLNRVSVDAGDTGSLPSFRTVRAAGVKYVLVATGSSGDKHALEVLLTHDGTVPYYTSYASLYTNNPMINITASIVNIGGFDTVTVGAENVSGEAISVGYLTHYIF